MLPATPKHISLVTCNQINSEETAPYHEYLSAAFQIRGEHTEEETELKYHHSRSQTKGQEHAFGRVKVEENNRKQRNIRSAHYWSKSEFQSPGRKREPEEQGVKGTSLKIGQVQRSKSKRLVRSAFGSRSEPKLPQQPHYLTPTNFNSKPAGPSFHQQKPTSSPPFPNCHVIYPFQSKLQILRLDDNPKLLSRVIQKKSKTLSRDDFYNFISALITRRLK